MSAAGDGAGARHPGGQETAATARTGGRRALAGLVLLGAAGSGLALLASRQGWAKVTFTVPPPFPGSTSFVTGQDLYPAGTALALAALASLAALLATAGQPRRLVGVIMAILGAGLGYPALTGPTAAAVLAAARQAGGPAGGGASAGSATAGSVTAGTSGGGAGLPLAGFPARVLMEAGLWRAAVLAGGLAVIIAGVITVIAARRLPAMSARYDRSAAPAIGGPADDLAVPPGARYKASARRSDASGQAALWDRLSAGEDPTS